MKKTQLALCFLIAMTAHFGAWAVTPVPMSTNLSYTENFADISNWTNNFASGIGANRWAAVATNAGAIPNATAITTATATFVTSTNGGVQKGTGNIVLLSTGASSNTSSDAIDFFMDYTGVNAGTLTFDAAEINNSTGDRVGTLKVYWSINGTSFTELTAPNLPFIDTNNVARSVTGITVSLPSAFNNVSTCRLRFYYYNGTGSGTTGSRPKIAIDNVNVTGTLIPSLSATALHGFGNVCTGTTAGPDSFTITGTALTAANVTVGTLSGYTYSTTFGGSYTGNLSMTQAGGSYSQKVYVKFSPALVQSYNGNIPLGGGGTTGTVNESATGAGINTAPSVATGGSSSITTTSATLAGSISATGCTAMSAYGIEYSTTNGFTPGTGTQVASGNLSGGNYSSNLSLLSPGTTYYYVAYATNGAGTAYGTQSSFTTTALVSTLSTTTLSGFGGVCTGLTVGPDSFIITGNNLSAANVNVGALSSYTYSTTFAGSYATSLSLTQGGGSYSQKIYVKFTPALVQSYNGNIPVNGGGAVVPADVAVTGSGVSAPVQPSSISGIDTPCAGSTGLIYSVTNVGGNTYNWTLPSGWTKTAGGTSNSITVTAGTASGTISVTANNGFCDGPAQTQAVTPTALPAQPSAIVGSATSCASTPGLSYSVINVPGVYYVWAVPSGWNITAGAGTNAITVTSGSAGDTISVTPYNSSCAGTPQTLAVSVTSSPTISSTANSGPICPAGAVNLTVNGANFSTYEWSDSTGTTSGLIYQQNFNNLPNTGTSVTWVDNSTVPGWYAHSSNLNNPTPGALLVGNGNSTTGGLSSFGTTSAPDRALGSLSSGTPNTITYGVNLTNTTSGPIDRIFVQYTGEQWRDGGGATSVANTLAFDYSTSATAINTGSYTAVTALNFVSPIVSLGAATALDGNLAANRTVKTATITLASPLASGSKIWLRWTDVNDAGNDMAISVDDLTVIMYNNSASLLATPSASISTATFGSGGAMTSAVYAAPSVATSGTYTVKAGSFAGCNAVSTTNVVFYALPTASLSGTATICAGSSTNVTVTASGTGPFSGTLTDGTTFSGTSPITVSVTPLAPSTYKIATLNDGHCTAISTGLTDSAVISFISRPTANITGATSICQGASDVYSVAFTGTAPWAFTIDTGGGQITGSTSASPYIFTIRPAATKTVKVSALSDANCTSQYADLDSQIVTVTTNCAITWLGTTSTSWHNAANWNPAIEPNSCSVDVVIPGGTTFSPVISTRNIQVGNITLGNSQTISLSGKNLSVCKNFGGPSSSANAYTISGTGKVIINGSSAQTIGGYGNMDELTVNNISGGVSLPNQSYNHVSLYRGLNLQSGNLTVSISAAIVLLSNSIDTAAWINDFGTGYTGTYSGKLTAQRKMPATGTSYQHQISAPVSGPGVNFYSLGQSQYGWHAAAPLIPSSNCSEDSLNFQSPYSTGLSWHESNVNTSTPACATKGWYTVGGPDIFGTGVGYSVYLTSASKVTLLGSPNTGTINVAGCTNSNWTTISPEGHTFNSGWSLVGNPYPSALNMSSSRLGDGFDNQVQIYHPSGAYQGTYQPGLLGNPGTPVSISSFQGFMVHKTNTGGTATWPFVQSERTMSQGPAYRFYKLNSNNSLTLTVSGNGFADMTQVRFADNATNGFDPELDANKFASHHGQPTLYTLADGSAQWMGINTLPAIEKFSMVPMGFEPGDQGTFTLTADVNELANFDADINIYLEDKLNPSNWTNLRAANTYTFSSGSNDTRERFVIHFAKTNAGINDLNNNANLNIFAVSNNIMVDFSKMKDVDATIQVFNILGQEISNEKHHAADTYVKSIIHVEAAYVIVSVAMTDGRIITKKLFITQ